MGKQGRNVGSTPDTVAALPRAGGHDGRDPAVVPRHTDNVTVIRAGGQVDHNCGGYVGLRAGHGCDGVRAALPTEAAQTVPQALEETQPALLSHLQEEC